MGLNLKKTGEESNTDFDALPEDRYNLKVVGAKLEKAKTGTPMITTEFDVLDGPYRNRKLWNNFTLTPKSLVFLFSFLKAAGSDLVNEEDIEPSDVVIAMKGMRVSAWTVPDLTPAGNPKNELSKWKPIASELVAGASGEPEKKEGLFS